MVAIPYTSEANIPLPSEVIGHTNGEIPSSALANAGFENSSLQYCLTAARANTAMVAAAKAAGITLRSTGTLRTFAGQVLAFDGTSPSTWRSKTVGRYVPSNLWAAYERSGGEWADKGHGVADVKSWNGKLWKRRAGTAMAAVPGKSRHGDAIAGDYAEESDGNWSTIESLNNVALVWLCLNAKRFGFEPTVPGEPWHWCYVTGDRIPLAVLEFEHGSPGSPPTVPPTPPTTGGALLQFMPTIRKGSSGPAVFALQGILRQIGVQPMTIDGQFGGETDRAVVRFQTDRGLKGDGIVGPKTWAEVARTV